MNIRKGDSVKREGQSSVVQSGQQSESGVDSISGESNSICMYKCHTATFEDLLGLSNTVRPWQGAWVQLRCYRWRVVLTPCPVEHRFARASSVSEGVKGTCWK